MDINQLRSFVLVARGGSFSSAARDLGLTQSGVSRQIRQIELELGFTLINRSQRPVTLTRAGKELLPPAENAVAGLEAAIQFIKTGGVRLAGPIAIAASTIPGEFLVPDLLARFAARHPEVRPSLLVTDSAGVVQELLARRADVGFLGAPMAHSRLQLIPFAEDEIVLVVPAGHPLARQRVVSLEDLSGQSLVEREGGSGTLESLKRLLAQEGMSLPEHRVSMIAGTSQAQLASIDAGAGIGFVSIRAMGSRPQASIVRVGIKGLEFKRTLFMAHERSSLSAVAEAFLKFVRGAAPGGAA